jgi:hypothetical protein
MQQAALPHLAHYSDLRRYIPAYGDYLIWSKWFTTWHGFIVDFDAKTLEVSVIFAGLPILLVTMSELEQKKETRKIPLGELNNATKGKYAVLRHDTANNANIWYV